MGSGSPIAMQEVLQGLGHNCLRARANGTYRPRPTDIVINWGNARNPDSWVPPQNMLNKPEAVNVAGNKLATFDALKNAGISIPEYTTSSVEASNWIHEGHVVVERQVLRGHSGEGIRIVRDVDDLQAAPLYVKYKKKKNEYRVHVFNGTVLFIQEKRRERDRERTADESLVRSHANGWVFCREGIEIVTDATKVDLLRRLFETALNTVTALGLDFGAVDIIYNQKEDKYYVLEVNTAAGLEGQSVTDYVNAILALQQ
jgi:carbamoylphosphate synthase large subunit